MPVIKYGDKEFNLSHDEEEKLNQFQMISSFPEDEMPNIINLLHNHGWNVEAALGRYFDGTWKSSLNPESLMPSTSLSTPPIPARILTSVEVAQNDAFPLREEIVRSPYATAGLASVPSLPTVNALHPDYKEKYRIIGLQRKIGNNNLWSIVSEYNNPIMILLMFLPKLLVTLGVSLFSFLWNLITFGFNSDLKNETKVFKVPSKPEEDHASIKDILPELIKDKNILRRLDKLVVNALSYNEALAICKDEYKFLLVILVGNMSLTAAEAQDINSQRFVTNILGNSEVLNKLEIYKDDLLIYMRPVQDLEAFCVSKSLRIRFTPECLLIGNVLNSSGSINGVTRLSVLNKLRITSIKKFTNSLKVTIDRFNLEMVVSKTEKEELRMAREIKDLQNQAYEASLKQDMIKEEERQVAKEKKQFEIEEANEKKKQKKIAFTLHHLKWLKSCSEVIREINAKSDPTEKKLATLQVRTSKGTRLIKKFTPSTTLHSIYLHVGCHLYLDNYSDNFDDWAFGISEKIKVLIDDDMVLCFKDNIKIIDQLENEEILKLIAEELQKWELEEKNDSDLTFDFELVSPFPRYKVPVDKDLNVKEVTQLWPNGSLMVEEIIDEEEESDTSEYYDEDSDDQSE